MFKRTLQKSHSGNNVRNSFEVRKAGGSENQLEKGYCYNLGEGDGIME